MATSVTAKEGSLLAESVSRLGTILESANQKIKINKRNKNEAYI